MLQYLDTIGGVTYYEDFVAAILKELPKNYNLVFDLIIENVTKFLPNMWPFIAHIKWSEPKFTKIGSQNRIKHHDIALSTWIVASVVTRRLTL
jgi:hypothetical protein